MDWFLRLPADVQIPIVGLFGSILAIAGVIVRGQYVRNPAKEREYRPRPMEVRLSDADREIIRRFEDRIKDHGEAIDRHREQIRSSVKPRRRPAARAPRT